MTETPSLGSRNNGWLDFSDPSRAQSDHPNRHQLVWLWRDGWLEPQLTTVDGMNPMMNIYGLYWQPAIDGVGRPSLPFTN